MKKQKMFFSILTILIFSNFGSAQFGMRAGVNFASVSIKETLLKPKFKLGFGLGVFYNLSIAGALSVQPELNFVQQGTNLSFSDGGNDLKGKLILNYIQVPVLIKYRFGNMDAVNFFIQAGPYLGLGIGTPTSETCFGNDCDKIDLKYGSEDDDVKGLDLGLNIGAGINVDKNISIDARYVLGFSNLNNDTRQVFKNKAINIGIGYSF